MTDPRIGVAVLAAGASRRFGDADKLLADFRGRPLGEYVCDALARTPATLRWVIASRDGHACEGAWRKAGFAVAVNERSSEGMGTSAALAARLAMKADCDALLIVLADTPLVPPQHYEALIAACTDPEDLICSANDHARLPPAIFGKARIGALAALSGDTGARALLQDAQTIPCLPE